MLACAGIAAQFLVPLVVWLDRRASLAARARADEDASRVDRRARAASSLAGAL
jgi:hypothetical protein